MSRKITKQLFEAFSEDRNEEDLRDLCNYMYEDSNGYVDDIPSKERIEYDYMDLTSKEYKKAYNLVKQAIEKVGDDLYSENGYNPGIELSNRSTILSLDTLPDGANDEAAMQLWSDIVGDAFKKFEEETGVEIWAEGRSGRHILVKNNFDNAINLDNLRAKQEELEDGCIEEFNRVIKETYGGDNDE